jgi:hypothetical protein
MKKADTQDVAGKVMETVAARGGKDSVAQIAVDDIGLGGGVTDTLRRLFPTKKVKAVIASQRVEDGVNFNLRAKMYWECKTWLNDAPNVLPNDPELKVQMSSIKYRYRGGLRLICSKKEEETKDMAESASGSPDRSDSLALGFAFPPEVEEDTTPKIPAPRPLDRAAGF